MSAFHVLGERKSFPGGDLRGHKTIGLVSRERSERKPHKVQLMEHFGETRVPGKLTSK